MCTIYLKSFKMHISDKKKLKNIKILVIKNEYGIDMLKICKTFFFMG